MLFGVTSKEHAPEANRSQQAIDINTRRNFCQKIGDLFHPLGKRDLLGAKEKSVDSVKLLTFNPNHR